MLGKIAIVLLAAVSIGYSCPTGYVAINHRCYYFSNETPVNFYGALHRCLKLEGHLLGIQTQAEQDVIVNHINSLGTAGQVNWWTSGSNNARDRNFYWFGTAFPIKYKDFCDGNEDGSVNHCVTLNPSCDFSWSIVDCHSTTAQFICEVDFIADEHC